MLGTFTLLLAYQLAGEVLVQLAELPVPGPVVGMVLLFVTLVVRGGAPESLRDTTNGVLRHLSLLFIPAGVGVLVHAARVAEEWLPIAAALVGSTAAAIVVTALTLRAMLARRISDHGSGGE